MISGPMVNVFFFFLILQRMGKNKALAHHTSTYFSYASCVDLTQLLSQPNASWRTLRVHCRYSVSCPYQWSLLQPLQLKLPLYTDACVCRPGLSPEGQFRWR